MEKRYNEKMTKDDKQILIELIKQDLKNILSEKRYCHSISTMEKAKQLATIYNEDIQKTMITALTHDIAKEMTIEEHLEYSIKNNVELNEDDKNSTIILHGIIGADIVKKQYSFTDEMCDAIYYHSTGRKNMTMLDKIIFLADKSEDLRQVEDADKLRKIIEEKGLNEAILWNIDYNTIPKMIENRRIIHPYSIDARNDIISKICH